MKTSSALLLLLLCASSAATAQEARPLTLEDAFRFALGKSETLAISGEGLKQLQAFQRAQAAVFRPEFSAIASETAAQGARGRGQAAINLNYDFFSGMRDYLAAKAAGSRTKAARLELARARQNLYLDVAAACIDLYTRRREIEIRRAQLEVTAGRVKELQARADIGRSRASEVLASKAQMAQDEASLASALAEENSSQIALTFLTSLEGPSAPAAPAPPTLPELQPYLLAARNRPDVEAARHAVQAAISESSAARRLGLPSLNLGANYYLKRQAPNEDDRWDAGLVFKIPLYTGGRNAAAADQYSSRVSAAFKAMMLAEWTALTEVRQAHSSLQYSLGIMNSLSAALALAKENSALQAKDYTYGLVTNLDVLNAQNSALQTALNLEAASAVAALAAARLETAAGLAPEIK